MCLRRLSLVLFGCLLAFSASASQEDRVSLAVPLDSPRLSSALSEYSLLDPRLSRHRLRAAGKMKAVSKVPALIQAYFENANRADGYGPSIQLTILETLAEIKSHEATNFLVTELAANPDLQFKDAIARALASLLDPNSKPALQTYRQYLLDHRPSENIALGPWQIYLEQAEASLQALEERRR
jgi:hypothetical protein